MAAHCASAISSGLLAPTLSGSVLWKIEVQPRFVVPFQRHDGLLQATPLKSSTLGRTRSRTSMGASANAAVTTTAPSSVSGLKKTWKWQMPGGPSIDINYVVAKGSNSAAPTVVLLPALSDVSTLEEFGPVAENLRAQGAASSTVIVDWPGFGQSGRPSLTYTAEIPESFLVDFLSASGPLPAEISGYGASPPVIVGAGHAATLAALAAGKKTIQAAALVFVAPTWAGPLPVVFGKDEKMESRYAIGRALLRSPVLGWALYKYTVANPESVRQQYMTHVYESADNLRPGLVESRAELPKQEGARFASASFITGQLDPVKTREEFVGLPAKAGLPLLVLKGRKSPKRSGAEMDALNGAPGVTKFVVVPGALLPHEEYAAEVSKEISEFIMSNVVAQS